MMRNKYYIIEMLNLVRIKKIKLAISDKNDSTQIRAIQFRGVREKVANRDQK